MYDITHLCTYGYEYICMYMNTYVCICTNKFVHAHTHACMSIHLRIYICTYSNSHHIHTCTYMCSHSNPKKSSDNTSDIVKIDSYKKRLAWQHLLREKKAAKIVIFLIRESPEMRIRTNKVAFVAKRTASTIIPVSHIEKRDSSIFIYIHKYMNLLVYILLVYLYIKKYSNLFHQKKSICDLLFIVCD